MRNERITLVTMIPEGTEIREELYHVFAERRSLTRSEFYASYQVGLAGRWIFDIDPDDYEMTRQVQEDQTELYATKVIYNGAVFDIVRTYQSGVGTMEITVK